MPESDLQFEIKTSGGEEAKTTSGQIMADLRGAGYNPTGMSADGTTLTLDDNDGSGPYQVPTLEAIREFGHQVQGIKPLSPNESGVNFQWRYAIGELDDEDAKKAFLESKIRRQTGEAQPKIVGSGRDWFYFNPASLQWTALTNKSSWDLSDLGEAAPEIVKGVASGAGGILGAAGGAAAGAPTVVGAVPGAILGGAGGAAAGGAAANAALKGLAAIDPDFRAATTMKTQLMDVGREAMIDAGFGGLFPAAGAVAPKLGAALARGVVSPVGRGVSAMAAETGGLAGGTARMIRTSPFAEETAQYSAPVLGDISLGGLIMQAPEAAATYGAKGLGRLGEAAWPEKYLGERLGGTVKGKARAAAEELLAGQPVVSRAADFSRKMRGLPPKAAEPGAAGIYRQLGRAVGRQMKLPGYEARIKRRLAEEVSKPGTTIEAYKELQELLAGRAAREEAAGRIGQQAGHVAEAMAGVGRGVVGAGRGITRAGLYGLEAGGSALQGLGRAAGSGFAYLQPFESRLAARYGFMRSPLMQADPYWESGPFQTRQRRDRIPVEDLKFAGR